MTDAQNQKAIHHYKLMEKNFLGEQDGVFRRSYIRTFTPTWARVLKALAFFRLARRIRQTTSDGYIDTILFRGHLYVMKIIPVLEVQ